MAPLYFVPSLKGLCFSNSAYPALKRWAKLFRANGAEEGNLWLTPLVPTTNVGVSHRLHKNCGIGGDLAGSVNCVALRRFYAACSVR